MFRWSWFCEDLEGFSVGERNRNRSMDTRPNTCDVACPSTAGRFLPDNRRNRRPYVRLARAAEIAKVLQKTISPLRCEAIGLIVP
jgi:hypothetical protein